MNTVGTMSSGSGFIVLVGKRIFSGSCDLFGALQGRLWVIVGIPRKMQADDEEGFFLACLLTEHSSF